MAGINQTLYVRDREDALLYLRAKLLSGGNLSALVATLLREWLDKEDPDGLKSAPLLEMREALGRKSSEQP